MELNDTTDYQQCFACGPNNPQGLRMVFSQEGEAIVSDFQPGQHHQGFPGVIHGGVIATLFDEALNRIVLLTKPPATWTMTGRLEVRYRRYVPYGSPLRVRAWLVAQRGRTIRGQATLTLSHDEHTVLAEAEGSFIALKPEQLEALINESAETRAFFEEKGQ